MGNLAWRFDEREYNYVKEVLNSRFNTSVGLKNRIKK